MSRVLIVSYLFPPFNGPGMQHPTWFYRYLREYGFDTVALTSSVFFGVPLNTPLSPDAGLLQVPQGTHTRRLSQHLYHAELWAQLRLDLWEPGFVWGGLFGIPAATRLLKRERFDAMISVSPTIASHWTALRLKRRFPDLKWIADFQDPFVGNPFQEKHAKRKLTVSLEQAIFSSADCLSANTDTAQAMWQKAYPKYRDKMVVTWGGFDPAETVAPLPTQPGETPVLKYVGAIYDGRYPTALVQSLTRQVAQGRLRPGDLIVEFVGTLKFGVLEPVVADLVRQGFIRLHPTYVSREEALDIAARAHYSLLIDIVPGDAVLQVPAKLFDQIRIGRPILAFTPAGSPTERILKDSGIPHVCLPPGAANEEVDAGILRLLQMPPTPTAASPHFQNAFSARHLAGQMATRIRGG